MTIREDVRRLVDSLPQEELGAARRYLEYLRDIGDPFVRALTDAPVDDEFEDEDERIEVEQSWLEYRKGEGRPWEEVWPELKSG